MKMFAKFVPFMLVVAMSVFTACGGDSGSNADSEEPVSSSAVKKSSSSKANSSSSKKVSSSSAKSSSSVKTSSSASNAKAIYDEKNNTMKDPRDNKTYAVHTVDFISGMLQRKFALAAGTCPLRTNLKP